MAQYYTDFSEYAVDVQPSDWTQLWALFGSEMFVLSSSILGPDFEALAGAQYLRYRDVGSFTRSIAKYDLPPASIASEIRGLARAANPTNTDSIPLLVLCGSGVTEAQRVGYSLWVRPGSGNYTIRRTNAGTDTAVASGTLPSDYYEALASAANTFYVRFEVVESGASVIVRSKVWSTADTEPGTWDLSHEDTTPLAAGWQGVGSLGRNATFYGAGWVGIGTDGDPAPTGPVDVSAEPFLLRHNPRTNKVIPVLSSPTVTDIGANCVRPRVTKGY